MEAERTTGLELVLPDYAEQLWLVVGLALLAVTLAALVLSARDRQWGWFLASLFLAPIAPVAYLLFRAACAAPNRRPRTQRSPRI